MKKIFPLLLVITTITFFSCQKENSFENGEEANPLIIGSNCRISKIVYADNATNVGIGSLAADINAANDATNITVYDSIGSFIEFSATPIYTNYDTVYINANEYFVVDMVTKRVKQLTRYIDPDDHSAGKFKSNYIYNATGNLVAKTYASESNPGLVVYIIDYIYTNGNLTHMVGTKFVTNEKVMDADLTYFTNILPQNFLYLFPDEEVYAEFNQFYNFGVRSKNAVKSMKVNYYAPGGVPAYSLNSTFKDYILSKDNYILSVIMEGDEQPSIPAVPKKMIFSYKCN